MAHFSCGSTSSNLVERGTHNDMTEYEIGCGQEKKD